MVNQNRHGDSTIRRFLSTIAPSSPPHPQAQTIRMNLRRHDDPTFCWRVFEPSKCMTIRRLIVNLT